MWQFLNDDDLDTILNAIQNSSVRDIVIAQDTPEFIRACCENPELDKFKREGEETAVYIGGNRLVMCLRDTSELDDRLGSHGFKLAEAQNLRYTPEFLERFPEFNRYPDLPAYQVLRFMLCA